MALISSQCFHHTESQCHKEAQGLNNYPCEECKSLIGGKLSLQLLWNTLTHTWNGHKQLDILTEGTTAVHQLLTNKSHWYPPFRQALSVNIYKPIFIKAQTDLSQFALHESVRFWYTVSWCKSELTTIRSQLRHYSQRKRNKNWMSKIKLPATILGCCQWLPICCYVVARSVLIFLSSFTLMCTLVKKFWRWAGVRMD